MFFRLLSSSSAMYMHNSSIILLFNSTESNYEDNRTYSAEFYYEDNRTT